MLKNLYRFFFFQIKHLDKNALYETSVAAKFEGEGRTDRRTFSNEGNYNRGSGKKFFLVVGPLGKFDH